MNRYLKVQGHSSLVRDANSHAIINTSKTEYENYMRVKEAAIGQTDIIKQQQHEIDSLRDELLEIKSLINQLIEK